MKVYFLLIFSFLISTSGIAQPSFDTQSYTVKKGDTYYSISKTYDVSVEALKKANKSEPLKTGQRLFIPSKGSQKNIQPIDNKSNTETSNPNKSTEITHVVKQGENLYRIAIQYNISAESIKVLNKLSSYDINVGQKLKIQPKVLTQDTDSLEKTDKNEKDINPYNLSSNEVRNLVSNIDEITQRGMVGVIENQGLQKTTNSFALHKNIKPGTILKLTNIENNHKILVKVVGTLPDIPENDKVTMKISSSAADYIGVKGKVFLAEITYAQKR